MCGSCFVVDENIHYATMELGNADAINIFDHLCSNCHRYTCYILHPSLSTTLALAALAEIFDQAKSVCSYHAGWDSSDVSTFLAPLKTLTACGETLPFDLVNQQGGIYLPAATQQLTDAEIGLALLAGALLSRGVGLQSDDTTITTFINNNVPASAAVRKTILGMHGI